MTTDEIKHQEWMTERAKEVRFTYIDDVTLIELNINMAIVACFTLQSRKQEKFYDFVLPTMNFQTKADMLLKILNYDYPKSESIHIALFGKIKTLYKKRNMFCHSLLATSPREVKKMDTKKIPFINSNNFAKQYVYFNLNELNKDKEILGDCIIDLQNINEKIKKRRS